MHVAGWRVGLLVLAIALWADGGPARAQTTTTTTVATTSTTIPAALRCKDRLLARARKLDGRLTRCAVKARKRARRGRGFDQAACQAAAAERYDRSVANARKFNTDQCPECVLENRDGVRDTLRAVRETVESLLVCDPATPLADRFRCERTVLRAVTKLQARLMRCRSEAAAIELEASSLLPNEPGCIAGASARFDEKVARVTCPDCVDVGAIRAAVMSETDAAIVDAHCPCRFGGSSPCGGDVCLECDVASGCGPGPDGRSCGRADACNPRRCRAGACVAAEPVECGDSNVCTIDACVDDGLCTGTDCCTFEEVTCPVSGEGAECVRNAECAPLAGCVYLCDPGCPFAGCL